MADATQTASAKPGAVQKGPYVFPGANGYFKEPRRWVKQVAEVSDVPFTLHDLRRTFITTAERQKGENGRKQPFYTQRRDGEPLMFAGLWEPTGAGTNCSRLIITQPAAPGLAHIHECMPVVLDATCWRACTRGSRTARRSAQ